MNKNKVNTNTMNNEEHCGLYCSIRYIMLFNLVFNFDLGFVNYKLKFCKYFIKTCCFVQAATVSVVILKDSLSLDLSSRIWHSIHVIEYFLSVCILLILGANFARYVKNFCQIDIKLNIDQRQYIKGQYIVLAFIVHTIIYRIIYGYFYCNWFSQRCVKTFLSYILTFYIDIAMDLNSVIIFIMFYSAYYRLKALRVEIGKKYGEKEKRIWSYNLDNKYDISIFKDIFKSIADNNNLIKPTIDAMVGYLFFLSPCLG